MIVHEINHLIGYKVKHFFFTYNERVSHSLKSIPITLFGNQMKLFLNIILSTDLLFHGHKKLTNQL